MRMFNYIFMMSAVMILFYLAGLNTSVGTTLGTLNVTQNPEGLFIDESNIDGITTSNSNFYSLLLLILAGAAVAGIGIGFITKSPTENLLLIPMVVFLATFIADMAWIILQQKSTCGDLASSCNWAYWVVIFIMVPLILGYIITLADWWRGHD